MQLKISILIFLLTGTLVHAQLPGQKMDLVVDPMFKGNIYHPGDSITIGSNTITLEKIRLYISTIQLSSNNKPVWSEPSSYHLFNLLDPKKNTITFDIPPHLQYDEIIFNLGVDSATNSSGVIGGDLDPTNGMYWTWQSGYINMKIEGYCATCPTRNHFFEYHLGGYQFPFASVQTISIKVPKGNIFKIGFDLEKFLLQVDMVKKCAIMSPGKEAVQLSQQAANSFYLVK